MHRPPGACRQAPADVPSSSCLARKAYRLSPVSLKVGRVCPNSCGFRHNLAPTRQGSEPRLISIRGATGKAAASQGFVPFPSTHVTGGSPFSECLAQCEGCAVRVCDSNRPRRARAPVVRRLTKSNRPRFLQSNMPAMLAARGNGEGGQMTLVRRKTNADQRQPAPKQTRLRRTKPSVVRWSCARSPFVNASNTIYETRRRDATMLPSHAMSPSRIHLQTRNRTAYESRGEGFAPGRTRSVPKLCLNRNVRRQLEWGLVRAHPKRDR